MIFAALPPSDHYSSIGWVCVILVSIIGGVRLAIGLWRDLNKPSGPERHELHPQPLQVEGVEKLATDKECRDRHNAAVAEAKAFAQQLEGLRSERKTDVGELHDKINKVDKEVGGLATGQQYQNQRMAEVNAKLDRLIERL